MCGLCKLELSNHQKKNPTQTIHLFSEQSRRSIRACWHGWTCKCKNQWRLHLLFNQTWKGSSMMGSAKFVWSSTNRGTEPAKAWWRTDDCVALNEDAAWRLQNKPACLLLAGIKKPLCFATIPGPAAPVRMMGAWARVSRRWTPISVTRFNKCHLISLNPNDDR